MSIRKGNNWVVQFVFFISITVFLIGAPSVMAGCKDQEPGGKPVLLSADAGEKSVVLTWQKSPDPVSYYLVRYGLLKENPEYGLPNIGDRDTTSFTVRELVNGQKYYFQVRAGNGCRPGDFSDTLSAIPGQPKNAYKKPNLSLYKQVLGETSTIETTKSKNIPIHAQQILGDSNHCAFSCYSLPILIGELTFLLMFFYFLLKYKILKTAYSVAIPIAGYVIFYSVNGSCNSYIFLCKYFLPISILTYLLTLILHKYYFFRLHIKKGQLSKN